MNDILQTFADYEEENYGAFKYINELSDELEHLQNVNKSLQKQIGELEEMPMKL